MVTKRNVPIVPRQNYGWPPCGGKETDNALDDMPVMEPRARQPRDVHSAIVKTLKEECNLNAQSWVLLTLDGGNQSTFSSPHLEKHKQQILDAQVQERFRKAHDEEAAGGVLVACIPNASLECRTQCDDGRSSRSSTPKGRRRKVRRTKKFASPKTLQSPDGANLQQGSGKDFAKELEEGNISKPKITHGPSGSVEDMRIRVDDTEMIEEFLKGKFNEMLQLNTKTIAKAWIKEICPAKQSKYPYNPSKSKKGNAPPPPWWPVRLARHKEPDHLHMDERIDLLVHLALLRECEDTPADQPFSVARKRACTESCVFDKPLGRRCFDEVLRVLERVEDYELGGIDGDTMITVRMFRKNEKSSAKRGRRRAASTVVDQESQIPEQDTEPEVEGPIEPDNDAEGGVTIGLPQDCDPWRIASATSSFVSQDQSQSRHKELPRNLSRQPESMAMSRARSNYELDRRFSQPVSGYSQAGNNLPPLRRVKTAKGPLVRPPPLFKQPTYQEQNPYEAQIYLTSRSMNGYQDDFFFPPTDTVQTLGPSTQDPAALANSSFINQPVPMMSTFQQWEPELMKPSPVDSGYGFMTHSSLGFNATPIESVDTYQPFNQASTMACPFDSMAGQEPVKSELSDWSTQLPWDEQRALTAFRTCSGSRLHDFPSYDPTVFYEDWPRH